MSKRVLIVMTVSFCIYSLWYGLWGWWSGSIEDIFLLSSELYFWTPWTEQRIHYGNLVNELWGTEFA